MVDFDERSGAVVSARENVGGIRQAIFTAFWLKTVGVSFFIGVFFWCYFYLLNHPATDPVPIPLTVVDEMIPMQYWAWFPYLSLWLYTALPPMLQGNVRQLYYFGGAIGVVCLLGLVSFYIFPTATPFLDKPDSENLAWLKGVDAAANACPSMHVAAAVFSAVWLDFMLKTLGRARVPRGLAVIWCLLIVYSTMATKQHVFLDVLAGFALGFLGGWLSVAGLRFGFVKRWIYNN